tara:strand:+ start:748 stop:1233 length:486 start_codon:yes stop_codon:yes gene_type:complete
MTTPWNDYEKETFLRRFGEYKLLLGREVWIEISGFFTDAGPVYNNLGIQGTYVSLNTQIVNTGISWILFSSNPGYSSFPISQKSRYAPKNVPYLGRLANRYFKKINFLYEYPKREEKSFKSFIKLIMTLPSNILPLEMIEKILTYLRRIDMFTYGTQPITQ